MIAKAQHGTDKPHGGLFARLRNVLFARRRARQAAEDAEDLALALERLRDTDDRPIPWEQAKRGLGL
jgi:hypothetical protein